MSLNTDKDPAINLDAHGDGVHVRQPFKPEDFDIMMDEKARKAGLSDEDSMKLVISAHGTHMEVRPSTVKAAAKQHTELAVVSLFTAIVKLFLIHVFVHDIAGFSDMPTKFESTTIDCLAFASIALDVLGAAFLVKSAGALFMKAKEVDSVTRNVIFKLSGVGISDTTSPGGLAAYGDVPDGFLGVHMDHPLDIKHHGLLISFVGSACFLASACLLIITTQRVLVWLPMMFPVILTIVWFSIRGMSNGFYVGGASISVSC
ncbi:hypothetical protein M413DRAFT_143385 [Hebeloma cylindrosporum]|uniref:Uncharacterized protein n=1 Tax=Hebeloma cylindrosporum TaxID=76867 RepID=A0A0C3CEG6_HEBCY|nr:hypothetical protein M413DRAFT_143385 [Hebeloma cylindrosporum h7]